MQKHIHIIQVPTYSTDLEYLLISSRFFGAGGLEKFTCGLLDPAAVFSQQLDGGGGGLREKGKERGWRMGRERKGREKKGVGLCGWGRRKEGSSLSE